MITVESTVKVAKDVIFQDLEGEAVLLNMQTEFYFGLDPMGTKIWHLLAENGKVKTVAAKLLDEYDITEDQLQSHLSDFLERLRSNGLIEVCKD
jgi:hypothetical protein